MSAPSKVVVLRVLPQVARPAPVPPPEGWAQLLPDERDAVNLICQKIVASRRPRFAVVRSLARQGAGLFVFATAKIALLVQLCG